MNSWDQNGCIIKSNGDLLHTANKYVVPSNFEISILFTKSTSECERAVKE